jgi:dienelactone hydrolase
MKKFLLIIFLALITFGGLAFWKDWIVIESSLNDPEGKGGLIEIKKGDGKNIGYLAKYNFENLRKRRNKSSKIEKIGKVLVVEAAREEFVRRGDLEGKSFDFESQAISFESEGKKISGMMNIPNGNWNKQYPTIIMIRGFADAEGYFIGSGSWKAADELARNGFVTVSLDFLGFGLSEGESRDILEARFEKPMSVLDLIGAVKELDIVDEDKIGIWAHSNGGQIAISVLEVTGEDYPTALWAPMTNPFPKSVLETIDDQSESGLEVKNKIEDFEENYDSKLYAIDNFYNWIEAPILIHQGDEDYWCKVEWQEDLVKELKSLGKKVELNIQKGNDHNLKQSWDEVIKMDIDFYRDNFQI